ncbi:MAG: type II toxin-antitoxin system Phd/YefM family antitoxin [Caldilinea sp.]
MTIEMTYTQARSNLAGLLDEVIDNREIVVIHRRHGARAAVIAADDLDSLLETAYLLRSPRNAERLLAALERSVREDVAPMSVTALRAEVGLGDGAA